MEKHGDMNLYTLDEFIDEEFGVAGTPTIQLFDAKVAERVMASKEKTSYHLTMPADLHDSIAKKAAQLDQSVSAYISTIMARELNMA